MSINPKARRAGSLFLFLCACLLVRVAALDADPPPWLSWSNGIGTDEGFYTLDARHLVLFGAPAPGDFHDRLLSPLLSLAQQAVFSVFGAGLPQARLLSVVFSLATIAVFWLGLARAFGSRAADWGAVFLGFAPPFVLYNRLALQETPTVFWLVLAFALWAGGRRGWSGLALSLAAVFKGLALLAAPGLLVGPWDRKKRGAVAGLLLGLLAYAVFWYVPHHDELTRYGTYYRVHQLQPHSWHALGLNLWRGFAGGERGVAPYLLALLPVPCVLALRGGVTVWGSEGGRVLAVWLLVGLGFCLVSSYAPSRYYLLFLPPLLGLAALGASTLPRRGQAAALAGFLLVSAGWLGAAWAGRTESRRDAARTLTRTLPPGSVVIGEYAPALCLDTLFRAAPVQPGLSNDTRPVEGLGATFVAVTRVPFWQAWWQARYPAVVQPSHRVLTFTLGGPRRTTVDVYKVHTP